MRFWTLHILDNEESIIDDMPLEYIDSILYDAIVYIAGFVERKLLKILKCETCFQLFNQCEQVNSKFINRKSFGFSRSPTIDTSRVVTICDKIFNMFKLENKLELRNILSIMVQTAFRNINCSKLFVTFDEHVKELEILENHKYILIKLIITFYFQIKLFHEGKRITL